MGTMIGKLAHTVIGVPLHPMPPVSDYEAWVAAEKARAPTSDIRITGPIFRRIAQLRRQHDTWAEIARCTGLSNSGAKGAWSRLPEELR